jgi:hypothetical protein
MAGTALIRRDKDAQAGLGACCIVPMLAVTAILVLAERMTLRRAANSSEGARNLQNSDVGCAMALWIMIQTIIAVILVVLDLL